MDGIKTFDDKLQHLDNKLRQLRKEVGDDLLKYRDKGWLGRIHG